MPVPFLGIPTTRTRRNDLACIERVRQDLAHDIRQGLSGRIGEPDPARILGRFRCARDPCNEYCELEREMCENVAYDAGDTPPPGTRDTRRRSGRTVDVEIVRPLAAGNFAHATEQAFLRATTQKHACIVTQGYESRTAPQLAFSLRHLARERLLVTARIRAACAI